MGHIIFYNTVERHHRPGAAGDVFSGLPVVRYRSLAVSEAPRNGLTWLPLAPVQVVLKNFDRIGDKGDNAQAG